MKNHALQLQLPKGAKVLLVAPPPVKRFLFGICTFLLLACALLLLQATWLSDVWVGLMVMNVLLNGSLIVFLSFVFLRSLWFRYQGNSFGLVIYRCGDEIWLSYCDPSGWTQVCFPVKSRRQWEWQERTEERRTKEFLSFFDADDFCRLTLGKSDCDIAAVVKQLDELIAA
ncbi:MAG: hypothetical protein RL095_344 [Verrucomicrobiota bacterium]|jgi:hypothetical protein